MQIRSEMKGKGNAFRHLEAPNMYGASEKIQLHPPFHEILCVCK